MPVKFLVEVVKGLFGISEPRESEQAELTETNITVEREPESEEAEEAETTAESESGAETDESESESAEESGPAGDPVGELSGIGPTYSERLVDIDIETVGDLASADATTVADAAQVSEGRASDWISQAEDW